MTFWAAVTRYLCMQCGFMEQYVDDAEGLEKIAKRYPTSS